MTTNFDAALAFHAKGYNVVPQAAVDKKYPGVKWKGLQNRLMEQEELEGWEQLFENGVGFITGAVSGIIVIESDGPEGEAVLAEFERERGPLADTLTIRSGSGRGLHRHFRHPGFLVKTVANPSIKLDVKGDKGYCVLPPSLHKSGGRYEIVHDFEPAPLPDGLLEFIEMKAAEAEMASPGTRASAGLVTTPSHANSDELRGNTLPAGRTPPPVETMRAVLHHLADRNYFADRGGVVRDANGCIAKVGWIETGMALKLAYGDDDGFDLWSVTHIDDRARADAPAQWASFAAEAGPRQVTIGTIIKAAKDGGFVFPTLRTDAAASGHVSHGPFTMDAEKGLTKEVMTGRGQNSVIETVSISAPFEILGQCRDPQGRAWGKQIRFRDADGREHMHHVSDAALHGEPGALCAELAGDGLQINRSRQKELVEYLSGVIVISRVTNVGRTGWHEVGGHPGFVLPAETIPGDMGERVTLDTTAHGPYEARGPLEDWKQGVGALTAGHALPVFMVSAALAGPLAYLVGAEGGGVHVFGPSSIGKSAMLAAGASVGGVEPRRATCVPGGLPQTALKARRPARPIRASFLTSLASAKLATWLPASIRWRTDPASSERAETGRRKSRGGGVCSCCPAASCRLKPRSPRIMGARRAPAKPFAFSTFPPTAGSASARSTMQASVLTRASWRTPSRPPRAPHTAQPARSSFVAFWRPTSSRLSHWPERDWASSLQSLSRVDHPSRSPAQPRISA